MPPVRPHLDAISNSARPDLYRVAGLLAACPASQDNPAECPLSQARRLSGLDLISWLFALTHQQVVAIENAHTACYRQKCTTRSGTKD